MIVNIIRFLHLMLLFVIAISPIIDNYNIKKYVFIFLVYLLFQYLTGYRKCGLTDVEYLVMGDKYQQGFIYRLINPIITVREDYFNNYLLVIHLCLIVILFLQLYNINDVIEYIKNI